MTRIERSPAQGTRVRARPQAPYNIFAEFPGMQSARAAIESLGTAGIDADDVSLLGRAAERAATRNDTVEMDTQLVKEAFWAALQYSTVGAIAGALLAIPITLISLEFISRDFTWGALGIGVFLGAFSGWWAGYAVGQAAPHRRQATEAWELTFAESEKGRVAVGVHSDDPDVTDRAARVLERHNPTHIHRTDRHGNRLHSR